MKFVADTHCLLWHLRGDSRLSLSARRLFDGQDKLRQVNIPTIVLAELMRLFHKYASSFPSGFEKVLSLFENDDRFDIIPLSTPIIRKAVPLSRFEIHDALIMATALELDLPLMTVDLEITASKLVPIINPL